LNTETLKFKVGLSGTYWGDKTPEYSISIGATTYIKGNISEASGQVTYIEFDAELNEGTHQLKISLLNKDASTDVVKDENDQVVKDILLNIESIEIDDIDIGFIRYTNSVFHLDKKQLYQGTIIDSIPSCVNLGFNGAYTLEFTSPFYLWLLENL
jgi:hypothetical protein